jgi:DnaJ-related protein SCJ1
MKVTYKNSADEYINVRAGNVVVTVQEIPNQVFERKGNDLKMKVDISLEQALLGFEKKFKHLDGHEVYIDRRDQVTKPGLLIRMKGEGMPVYQSWGDAGDLLITIVVNLPEQLNGEEQAQWQ